MRRIQVSSYVLISLIAIFAVSCGSTDSDESTSPEEVVPVPESPATEVSVEEVSTDVPAPVATVESIPAGPYVKINAISLSGSTYIVEYETFEYTESLPGMHVHFYFNSVAPDQAGVGGNGPWYVWGGPRPFNGYTTNDQGTASQICALVANGDHTIQLNTGNCYDLPNTPAG